MDLATPPRPKAPAANAPAAQPDPREREDWFRRLPPAVQQQTRAKWQAQEQRDGPHAERHRRFRIRSILEGLALMALVQGFYGSASLFMVLPAAAMGAGIGFLWYLMRAGPTLCVLSSGLSWTLLLVFDPLGMTTLIKSVVVLCTLAAAIGIGRESWYRSDAIGW
jgi:hypothetical protein